MFSRDGRYEVDVEKRIAACNSVNGALGIWVGLVLNFNFWCGTH